MADVRRIGRDNPRRVNECRNKSKTSSGILGFADPDLCHGFWRDDICMVDIVIICPK